MRDLALVSGLLFFLAIAIRYPYAGLLAWGWLTFMNPHQLAYGFAAGKPLNVIVAVVTIVAWALSREQKRWPRDPLPKLMLILVIWMTINSFFAADPDWSWPLWDRTVKIYAFIFLALAMMRNKARLHGMVWVLVISIGFYSVKGGAFTIISAGAFHVWGPPGTIIGDNNQLALAVVVVMPLTYYLMQNTENRWLRLGFKLSFPLQIATVLGSYSRGGVIALFSMLAIFWTRSRHKLAYLVLGGALLAGGLALMPPTFFSRMETIRSADKDSSFMGRVTAWKVATEYAVDHFPFGAGFAGPQRAPVFNYYFPAAQAHAAHSIYFQVLGEHGFPGLLIFLITAAVSLKNARLVVRRCRGRPELAWMHDLASMLEVSLIGFFIGGAALSMAYYDGFLIMQAMTSVLRHLTEPEADVPPSRLGHRKGDKPGIRGSRGSEPRRQEGAAQQPNSTNIVATQWTSDE